MKKEFFEVVSVDEFFRFLEEFKSVEEEERLDILEAYDRVLAKDVFSPEDLPQFNRATMDGYAVKAKDTFGASESNPVYLKNVGTVEIGSMPDFEIHMGECCEIVTGAPLPRGADSVVMVEYTEPLGDEVEIRRSVAPGENTIFVSEDCKQGERVLNRGMRLRGQDIGILAALGITHVDVFKKIKVGIISTGDELVEISKTPRLGEIRDVNSYTLHALCKKADVIPLLYGIVRDDLEELKTVIFKALRKCHVVLISGGSSVGTRDLTIEAIKGLDGDIWVHGVSISPGKPTILSNVQGKPVIGLPGQVASAQIVMFVLILPFLRHLSGEKGAFFKPFVCLEGVINRNVPSKQGREDYIRVKIKKEHEKWVAEPIFGKSGLLRTLLQADGLVRIPSYKEGLEKGERVKIILF